MKPKEIRKAAGVSLIAAAVGAGVSETTARIYEANADAVTPEKRARLDSFYASLSERGASEPPPRVA